jgi:adenosylcobinamide kinase / adenosylcobinamide-phosphate guanylyltransferase
MGRIIFITGGARSGKSSYALQLEENSRKKKIFMATCIPHDREMKQRVSQHKKNRTLSWKTVEAGEQLLACLKQHAADDRFILIDCLTLYISYLLVQGQDKEAIRARVKKLCFVARRAKAVVCIVSNEVGMGLVPENKLGRDFRDLAGFCNQIVAEAADEAYFLVSGIALRLKPQG